MGTVLSGIHFLLTYRCTYDCDHCFIWGSPEQQGTMTAAQVREVIDQAVSLGTVEHVYFEGGEPMLMHPVLLASAGYARERSLDFGVVTNSFFAESEEDAALWLEPLQRLDIMDLSLSSYPHAGEEGEPRLLRNALSAALGLGMPVSVLESGAAADVSDLGVACGDPADIMYRGRAAEALAPEQLRRAPETLVTCPHEDLTDPGRAHVGCDGELQVCQGLSAGNVFAEGLAAITGRYDAAAMPVTGPLLRGGPRELARVEGLKPQRELYADECHLCYELRARLRERYPSILVPDQAYGVVGTES